ncbi:MAG: ferredoxin, partial [Oscillatoriales cyanobacterium]
MSQTYTVEFLHQGSTYTVEVPEDQPILQTA